MQCILGTMTFASQVDHDTSAQMITTFRDAGFDELDSAYVYNDGKTEELLGDLNSRNILNGCRLATKVNPLAGGLGADSVDQQFLTSLQRMGVDRVDLLYLHQPDLDVPIRATLAAVHKHYEAGRFERFGLSNYSAWQVAEISEICRQEDWMLPVVYQGMYNALTRDVERELLLCLQNYNIAFYVYNPLAGGMLSGKHLDLNKTPGKGRFDGNVQYLERYWKPDYFEAINAFSAACKEQNIQPANAALRWLKHHSDLQTGNGDAIIIGASAKTHFEQNLAALQQPALPDNIVAALDHGWELARPNCIKYFRP
ncbi:hypothetical protein AB833_18960 [Chromatiales bacterium (ex Bugula neritina AB1)]|nr:hypothetical protein AB833_18960 [Chromatiales bacterium (ex Bugula neritina AB1)]